MGHGGGAYVPYSDRRSRKRITTIQQPGQPKQTRKDYARIAIHHHLSCPSVHMEPYDPVHVLKKGRLASHRN
jgi:hypothetical protein